jgi:hypothetical protein
MAKERQLSQEVKVSQKAQEQRFRRIAPRERCALQAAFIRQEQDAWSASSLE